MNEMLIILATFCSILLLFIGIRFSMNLIVKVIESEHCIFGDEFLR